MAARQSFYKRLLDPPIIVVIQPGLSPKPLFRYKWLGESLGSESGRITFKNLTRHPEINRIYMMFLMGLAAEKYGELAEMVESAGGKYHNVTGKKVGEAYGAVYNTTVRLGNEIGVISGYKDDARERAMLSSHMADLKMGRAVVKAPDGYLHIYELDPAINAGTWTVLLGIFTDIYWIRVQRSLLRRLSPGTVEYLKREVEKLVPGGAPVNS